MRRQTCILARVRRRINGASCECGSRRAWPNGTLASSTAHVQPARKFPAAVRRSGNGGGPLVWVTDAGDAPGCRRARLSLSAHSIEAVCLRVAGVRAWDHTNVWTTALTPSRVSTVGRIAALDEVVHSLVCAAALETAQGLGGHRTVESSPTSAAVGSASIAVTRARRLHVPSSGLRPLTGTRERGVVTWHCEPQVGSAGRAMEGVHGDQDHLRPASRRVHGRRP